MIIKYKEIECSKLGDWRFESIQDFSRYVDDNKVIAIRFDILYPKESVYQYDEYYTPYRPSPHIIIMYTDSK